MKVDCEFMLIELIQLAFCWHFCNCTVFRNGRNESGELAGAQGLTIKTQQLESGSGAKSRWKKGRRRSERDGAQFSLFLIVDNLMNATKLKYKVKNENIAIENAIIHIINKINT